MRCTLIKARELSADSIASWAAFQTANPLLDSPALRPELFQIVGRHYKGAEVAIFEDAGATAGFLPLNRHPLFGSIARPIPICDYQDFIRAPGCQTTLTELLQTAGIKTWIFEHLLAPPAASPEVEISFIRHSKRILIESTWEDYLAGLKANGKSMKNILTKLRLLARDHGEVVFTENSGDPAAFAPLLEWKAQRFNNGTPLPGWIGDTLREIHTVREPAFSGVLGTLHAGDKLVAAHFGIKSGRSLYYWFPAFNPEFSKYTPGWLLVYFLLKTAPDLGCDTIDLGPGGEPYKDYFSNLQIPVSGGFVELPGAINLARRSYRALHSGLRSSGTAKAILGPVRDLLRRF